MVDTLTLSNQPTPGSASSSSEGSLTSEGKLLPVVRRPEHAITRFTDNSHNATVSKCDLEPTFPVLQTPFPTLLPQYLSRSAPLPASMGRSFTASKTSWRAGWARSRRRQTAGTSSPGAKFRVRRASVISSVAGSASSGGQEGHARADTTTHRLMHILRPNMTPGHSCARDARNAAPARSRFLLAVIPRLWPAIVALRRPVH
ncbi:hypothetical protein EI94DRAFT_325350 [Lactarius quietus]|nr:hypothetical protein EI94DRAFT_325350 [Lactarius quietus]